MTRLLLTLTGIFATLVVALTLSHFEDLGVAYAHANPPSYVYTDEDGEEVLVESAPGPVRLNIPPPPVIDPRLDPPKPSTTIDNPLDNPIAAFDDLAVAQRHGWPALVLAVGIMLALTARRAGTAWPEVGWLAWLNTGARAFVIVGAIEVGSAAFNALLLGGTWAAVGWAAFLAAIALVSPLARRT